MDEEKIVEAIGLVVRAGKRCGDPESAFPCHECDMSFNGGEGCLLIARSAWNAAKAALAEATRDILRNIEAAARVAEHEALAAPGAPGWPATCAVLRYLKELREVLTAAPGHR